MSGIPDYHKFARDLYYEYIDTIDDDPPDKDEWVSQNRDKIVARANKDFVDRVNATYTASMKYASLYAEYYEKWRAYTIPQKLAHLTWTELRKLAKAKKIQDWNFLNAKGLIHKLTPVTKHSDFPIENVIG